MLKQIYQRPIRMTHCVHMKPGYKHGNEHATKLWLKCATAVLKRWWGNLAKNNQDFLNKLSQNIICQAGMVNAFVLQFNISEKVKMLIKNLKLKL